MGIFQRVPDGVRPTYMRLLAYGLMRSPSQAMMVGLASLIAVKSLNAPAWEVALLAAALPFGNLLGVFWSRRIARSSRKQLYAFWPEIGAGIILFSIAFANNSHTFTAGLSAFLLLRAPAVLAHSAIMRSNYPAEVRSTLLARILAMSKVLIALFGLAAGYMLEFDPRLYRVLFPLAGCFSIMAGFQILRVRINGEDEGKTVSAVTADYSFRRVLGVLRRDPRFARYELSFFLFGFANIMTLPIIPLFLEHDIGIHYRDAGWILVTLPMLLESFMLPMWGRKLDRHNPLLMRAMFNVIFSGGILIYFLSSTLWFFAMGRLVVAFVQGGSALIWILGINYFAPRDEVPVYMGLHQSLTGYRGLIAPFVGILIAHAFGSYRAVFIVSFLLMNVGTLVMINEVRGERRRNGGLPSYAQAERQIDTRYSA